MSRTLLVGLIAIVVIGTGLMLSAAPQTQPAPRTTLFSTLKVGQSVALRDRGGSFEISTMDDADLMTHKVIEIGDTYLALRDVAGVLDTRIPVYAIKALIHINVKVK